METSTKEFPVLNQMRCKELCEKAGKFVRYFIISAAGNPNWEIIYTNNHLPTIQAHADKCRKNLGYNKVMVINNPLHPFNKMK